MPADGGHADVRTTAIVITLVHVAIAVLAFLTLDGDVRDDDVLRFHDVATAAGAPWRDRPVEYAPGEVVFIEAIAGADATATGRGLVGLALVADLAIAGVVASGWGPRAATRYLLIALPILPFIFLRFDLVPTAMAVGSVLLARRGHQRSGGVLLAVAILTKLWPAVLLPVFILDRRPRALRWALVAAAVGTVAWVAYAGFDGPRQVMSFRGAGGWGIGSLVGVVVWIVGGGPVRVEQGAPRVGSVPDPARAGLAVALVAVLVAAWWRARRWAGDVTGAPALVAVSAVMVLSPLLSLQYAAWLLPFAAIASLEREARFAWWSACAAVGLTGLVFIVGNVSDTAAQEQAVIAARGVALAGIPIWWFVATGRRTPDGAQPASRSVTS